MEDGPRERGAATRSVHAGELRQQEANAITTPIYQTSTFWFETSQEVIDYQEGKTDREEYGRYGNPTWRAVERKLSELEGGEETVLFGSGMCAATTTFMALLPPGSHLIVTSDCYRRTRQFIQQYLSKLGVTATVIEPANTIALKDAIRDETAIFFTETEATPQREKDLKEKNWLPGYYEENLRHRILKRIAFAWNGTPGEAETLVDDIFHTGKRLAGEQLSNEIVAALRDFAGIPHRSQWVADIDGVEWINDSKATNPDVSRVRWASLLRICCGVQPSSTRRLATRGASLRPRCPHRHAARRRQVSRRDA